ncbi:MAG: S1C family serine protease [Planctomycetota bacterium]
MPAAPRQPLVSCSPWALLILLVFAGVLIAMSLVRSFLSRTHDPEAVSRAIDARGDLAEDERATIELFRAASPAVVHIDTVGTVYDRRLRALEIPKGAGSGFIWDERGYVITNLHVLSQASRAFVFLEGSSTPYEARFVGGDPDNDVAVLKIEPPGAGLQPLLIGTSKDLQVGQKVFAIGNPFGLDHTLTTGIISGLGREILSVTDRPIQNVIQTDAAINPGNSGGPLLDSAGRLIGMNTAIVTPGNRGEGFNVGVGFAVPVDTINKVVPSLIRNGTFVPPRIGVRSASEQVARSLGVEGVVVEVVESGSGAEKAGLRSLEHTNTGAVRADVITAVDGQPIADIETLRQILSERKVGDFVRLEILRDGDKIVRDVELK